MFLQFDFQLQIDREDSLELHPRYFGKNVNEKITEELRRKVEGKCIGRFGYFIAVTQVKSIGKVQLVLLFPEPSSVFVFFLLISSLLGSQGVLHPDSGFAHFPVKYLALVFRPFKNEILPAVVTHVSSVRFFHFS